MKKYLLLYIILLSSYFSILQAQVQLTATGSANNFIITYPAVIQSVPNGGMQFSFRSNQTITGPATLNLNGTGPKSIFKNYNQPLSAGDIKAGHFVQVVYDATNDVYQMMTNQANPTGNMNGSGTVGGVAFFTGTNIITADGSNFSYLNGNNISLAIGKIVIRSTSSSGDNLSMGVSSGNNNITGNSNSMYGQLSGNVLSTGSENAFFGTASGQSNSGGTYNSFFGSGSGYNNISGTSNSVFGSDGGYNNTGSDNVFIGRRAGLTNTSGSKNVIIGSTADVTSTIYNNAIAIGYSATVGGSNMMALGGTGFNAVNVGIGTGSPSATLDVVGGARIRNLSSAGTNLVQVDLNGNLQINVSNYLTSGGTANFVPYFASGTALLNSPIRSDGSTVAINTLLNSNYIFQVDQSATAYPAIYGTSSSAGGIAISGYSNNVTPGSVGIAGVATGGGTGIKGSTNGSGAGVWGVNAGLGPAGYFQNTGTGPAGYFSGNLGINTNTPNAPLHVVGAATISGLTQMGSAQIFNFTAPGIVQADAAGNLFVNTLTGGISDFKDNYFTASPNNTINAAQLIARGPTTDIDFVITPKGAGAILASVPDGTATGGNKRGGLGALDLQRYRTTATQVASGSGAILIGGNYNTASGSYSFIGSGNSNTAASSNAGILTGQQNLIGPSAGTSGIISGSNNSITGTSGASFIGAGNYNIVIGNASTIGAGSSNTVSGDNAGILSGVGAVARSYGEAVVGTYNVDYAPSGVSSFQTNDRIFTVGNGASAGAPSNALTILKNGNVGIGVSNPVYLLHGAKVSSTAGDAGIYFTLTTSGSGNNSAIWGDAISNVTSGEAFGVIGRGYAASTAYATGVYGQAFVQGTGSGVITGVWGEAIVATTNDAYGVYGRAGNSATNNYAMSATITASGGTSNNYGIYSYVAGGGTSNYGAFITVTGTATNKYGAIINGGSLVVGTVPSSMVQFTNTGLVLGDGHLRSVQTTAPSIANVGATLGALANATDVAGIVTFTSGTAAGGQVTITFSKNYAIAPIVLIYPGGTVATSAANAAGQIVTREIYTTTTTTSFKIYCGATGSAMALSFYYVVIETQ